jgi:hypothetical protein
MRQGYVHDAVIAMPAGAEVATAGAAVTEALCGSSAHEPPCPLAAHYTHAVREGAAVRLRILFACAPADEARVRSLIESALSARWPVVSSSAGTLHADESAHAARLSR